MWNDLDSGAFRARAGPAPKVKTASPPAAVGGEVLRLGTMFEERLAPLNADQEYGEFLYQSLGSEGDDGGLPDGLLTRLANEQSVEDVVRVHAAVLDQRLASGDDAARRPMLLRATRLLAAVLTRFGWATSIPHGAEAEDPAPAAPDPAAQVEELKRTARALAETRAMLRKATATDPLTGVLNARQFYALFELHLSQARQLDAPLALLMADVDRFGQCNLRCGRRAGDAALVELARLILRCCRASDIVTRYAGDEFAVVCPGTDLRGGLVLAERIRDTVEHYEFPHHHLTVSVGVVSFPGDADSEEQLLSRAHQAVAEAVRFGGNVVHTSLVPAAEPAEAD